MTEGTYTPRNGSEAAGEASPRTVATTWGAVATACPPVQVSTVLKNPATGAPVTLPGFTVGMLPTAFVPALQQLAVTLEAVAERGAGVYAVLGGFDFSDGGGLTLRIADGAALIGGYVGKFTPTLGYATVGLTDGVTNHVWLSQTGGLNCLPDLSVPGGPHVYLGSATAAAGAITGFDLSGVVTLASGGLPSRTTGDAGMPADTPPASARFIQRSRTTAGDHVFTWDGSGYDYRQPFGTETPAAFSTNRNDYPIGAGTRLFRVSASSAVNLTGIAGGIDGRMVWIFNVGSNAISLRNEDSGSLAANRLHLGGNINLIADASQPLIYDGTSLRWRPG